MDKTIENIIALLQQGKSLPEEYRDLLFPINNAECELSYGDVSVSELQKTMF